MSEKIGVLIVDDHRAVADGLAMALAAEPALEVLGTASTASDALDAARRLRPKVALVDYRLPDGTGAQLAGRLREEVPGIAVVMLSADSGDEAFLASVEAGVAAYLSKTEELSLVADTVRGAAGGAVLLPAARLADALRRQLAGADRRRAGERRLATLTPREREVLDLMATGLTSRQLAERMSISVPTARGHVQMVIEKLGVHSRDEALRLAVEMGAVERRGRPRG